MVSYLSVAAAAYAATLQPATLSLRIGYCGEAPCVTWVMPAGNAWDTGVRPGDTLLTVDGRDVSGEDIGKLTSAAIKQAVFRTSEGERLLVTVEHRVILRGPIKLSLWLLGGLFAVLGSTVLLRRPDLSSARWFGAFAGFVAAALAVGPAAGGPQPLWAFALQFITVVGVGATCLPFVAALVGDNRRLLLPAAFAAVAFILVVTYGISVLAAPTLYAMARLAVFLFVTISLFGAVVLLAATSRRLRSFSQRQQSRIALLGIGLGTLPFISLTLVPEVSTNSIFVPSHVSVLAVGLIPLAFAYAILQHDLLGIRRLVHRGMVYGFASVTTLVLILLGLAAAEPFVNETGAGDTSLLHAVFLTVGVVLFFPVRRGARWLVDRIIYGDVARYEQFADLLRDADVTADPTSGLISGIAGRLVDALHLESAVLFLGDGPSDARLLTAAGPGPMRW